MVVGSLCCHRAGFSWLSDLWSTCMFLKYPKEQFVYEMYFSLYCLFHFLYTIRSEGISYFRIMVQQEHRVGKYKACLGHTDLARAEEKWLTKLRICDSGWILKSPECQDIESKIIQWVVGLPSRELENGSMKIELVIYCFFQFFSYNSNPHWTLFSPNSYLETC